MGVRFNAEKKKVGNYYSTPILSFRMKCHLCSHWWEIRTDPKNTQYVVISGAKQKNEEWDPVENGTLKLLDDKEREKIQSNPISKLEHVKSDKRRAEEEVPIITELKNRSDDLWGDIYAKSKLMRKKLREEKKVIQKEAKITEALRSKNSLHIKLLPEKLSDTIQAKQVDFRPGESQLNLKLKSRLVQPLFASAPGRPQKTPGSFLKEKAQINSRLVSDPFVNQVSSKGPSTSKVVVPKEDNQKAVPSPLVAYDSD
ncbi:Protein saf4, variant 3 [Entomophthora muscae]|nr:Protein saf4, variant 3 [Entomophthora muscae]